MKGLAADLRHACRIYLASPLASGIAILVLAVSLAVLATFFSLWSDLALKSHPGFAASDELVTVSQYDNLSQYPLSYRLIERINEEVSALASIAGTFMIQQFIEIDGEREEIRTELVTRQYFPDIRPRLQLGRGFDAQDHDVESAPVVVLSHAFWQEKYDGDPSVLGRVLLVQGPNIVLVSEEGRADAREKAQGYEIVGVMAESQPGSFLPTDVWMPFEQSARTLFGDMGSGYLGVTFLQGIGRLADKATSVRAIATELEARYRQDDPDLGTAENRRIDVVPGLNVNTQRFRELQNQVRLFLAGSLLLTLVAACNVSLFLLSRAPGRRRELGIRMSVGAPTKRLARQLMTEAAFIVVLATTVGGLISLWLLGYLKGLAFLSGRNWGDASLLDWRVLVLIFAAMLLLALLVSVAPMHGLKRLGISASSRQVTARAGWAQRVAGTTQLVIAGLLASAAISFGWYLNLLLSADRGFDATGLYAMSVEFEGDIFRFTGDLDSYAAERERRRQYLEAIPGIEGAAFGTSVPGRSRSFMRQQVQRQDGSGENAIVMVESADPAFIDLLDLELLTGRRPVSGNPSEILVNETMATEIFGRTDIAGETIPVGFGPNQSDASIVGVFRDVQFTHPSEDSAPRIWREIAPATPLDQFVLKTDLSEAEIRESVQRLIDDGTFEFTITSIDRINDLWLDLFASELARAYMSTASAVLVVVLAGFGFYGTQRYLVSAGRREYAIRAAMGAGPRAIGRLVLSRGLTIGLPGLVLSLVLSLILVAWLRDEYVSRDVSPYVVVAIVACAVLGLILVSTFGPARQARRSAPAPVLREE